MKFIDVEQGSAEWLALRRRCIGASDIPVIMGVSPFTTRYQLWKDKMGIEEIEVTNPMRYGKMMEDQARNDFCVEHDIDIFPRVCLHSNGWALASLDGLSLDGKVLAELKCPGSETHNLAANGIVPDYYIPQMQWQMYLTELDNCKYYSWSAFSTHTLPVYRDEQQIKTYVKEAEKFIDLIRSGEPPELEERDYKERNDDLWIETAEEWFCIQHKIKCLQEREDLLRDKLIRLSQGFNTVGGGIKLRKIPRKGNVEYKSIPELNGVDLEQYRKPSSITWRIGVS